MQICCSDGAAIKLTSLGFIAAARLILQQKRPSIFLCYTYTYNIVLTQILILTILISPHPASLLKEIVSEEVLK